MSSVCSKGTLSGQVRRTKKTCQHRKEVTGGFGGHRQGLSGKERIRGHFPSSFLAPSRLSARVALGYNNCPRPPAILMRVMEKVVFRVWPFQDSGWEDCGKEHSLIPITLWRFEDLRPHHCLIPDNGKIYRMVAFSFFPSSPLFCGDLILWNSVLPPGWQEMMKIHGAFHKRRLTCKGGQARIPEYSLSTFSKLSCLDAKCLQWRASQGCFLRSDKKYKKKTSWHIGHFSRLTNNIDFCLCCCLMLLDLTQRWEKFEWGQGGGPCDNHSQLREWLLTGLPQRCILSRADTSEPETWRETSFWCMTPFPFGGGIWHCFSDLLDLVLSFSFPFSVYN